MWCCECLSSPVCAAFAGVGGSADQMAEQHGVFPYVPAIWTYRQIYACSISFYIIAFIVLHDVCVAWNLVCSVLTTVWKQ